MARRTSLLRAVQTCAAVLAIARGEPWPDTPSDPLPASCNPYIRGCYSDGCMEPPGNCPVDIVRALGGDDAVHKFDKDCPDGQAAPCKGGLTRNACLSLCAYNNFRYAGMEGGSSCYCSNAISSGPQTHSVAAIQCNVVKDPHTPMRCAIFCVSWTLQHTHGEPRSRVS